MLVQIPEYESDPLPEPENGNGDNGRPSLYWLMFLIILSSRIWWKAPGLDMSSVFNAANIRIGIEALAIATGWTAALALVNYYIWPAFANWFNPPPGPEKTAVPADDQPPPKPRAALPPQVNGYGEEPNRAEQTAAQPGQTRAVIGNQLVDLADYGVDIDHWQRVKQARVGGSLPDVSLPKLHALGIDRKHRASEGDSDAHRVIDMMLDLELIADGGERKPFVWTGKGEGVLPHPATVRIH